MSTRENKSSEVGGGDACGGSCAGACGDQCGAQRGPGYWEEDDQYCECIETC